MGGKGSGAAPKIYAVEVVDAVRRLYAGGATQTEVGAILGLSQKVIWSIMRRHSISARVAAKRNQMGESNSSWKGASASYKAKHQRLYRHNKQECERCGTTDPARSYDWANLTGDYDNPDDYERMCRSCHWRFDNKIANLKGSVLKGGGATC